MIMSPGERVLEMTELHRLEAELLERRGLENEARLMRSIAEDYERVVRQAIPEWVSLDQAQRSKGWSDRWWRERCRELEPEDLARKHRGRWQIHRSALADLPRKPGRQEEIEMEGDVRELAARLADED